MVGWIERFMALQSSGIALAALARQRGYRQT